LFGEKRARESAKERIVNAGFGGEEFAELLIRLLEGTPIVEDEAQMRHFLELSPREKFLVARIVDAGEARTVEGALRDLEDRSEAHERALRIRSTFRALPAESSDQ
jgi:hypothetical protein